MAWHDRPAMYAPSQARRTSKPACCCGAFPHTQEVHACVHGEAGEAHGEEGAG